MLNYMAVDRNKVTNEQSVCGYPWCFITEHTALLSIALRREYFPIVQTEIKDVPNKN
jgi:hypothetical protein